MSERIRTMSPPVHLGMPLAPPAPVVHCAVCNVAANDRRAARDRGDLSAVTDANVVIRQHPHDGMGAAR